MKTRFIFTSAFGYITTDAEGNVLRKESELNGYIRHITKVDVLRGKKLLEEGERSLLQFAYWDDEGYKNAAKELI